MESPEIEKAAAILEKARLEKIQACLKEVQEVLEKHGCLIKITPCQAIIDLK